MTYKHWCVGFISADIDSVYNKTSMKRNILTIK